MTTPQDTWVAGNARKLKGITSSVAPSQPEHGLIWFDSAGKAIKQWDSPTQQWVIWSDTVKTAPTISSGVLPVDCSNGNVFTAALNANITSFTLSNIPASGSFYGFILEFTADGTARTVAWSFSSVAVKWPGGTAPTMTITSGKKDSFAFYTHDGGTTWIGAIVGQNL